MNEQHFKDVILTALEYSYLHDDWVNPLSDALAGVTVEAALWRPGPDSKGIWDIVLHLAVWNENIIERMRTGEKCRPLEGAWPTLPPSQDEAAWATSRQRLWDSLTSLRGYIESNPIEALQGPYGLGDLFCRIIHMSYHIGQITKLQEIREAK